MSEDTNRQAYERFVSEVLVQGNLDALDELVASDVVSHSPFPGQRPGRAGFRDAFAYFRRAFPELRVTVHDIIASRDKVVGYFAVSGEQRGDFMGLPATGKTVEYEEMVIVRFADAKIVEHWSVSDTLAMMQTLGAVTSASNRATQE